MTMIHIVILSGIPDSSSWSLSLSCSSSIKDSEDWALRFITSSTFKTMMITMKVMMIMMKLMMIMIRVMMIMMIMMKLMMIMIRVMLIAMTIMKPYLQERVAGLAGAEVCLLVVSLLVVVQKLDGTVAAAGI